MIKVTFWDNKTGERHETGSYKGIELYYDLLVVASQPGVLAHFDGGQWVLNLPLTSPENERLALRRWSNVYFDVVGE